MMIFMCFIRAEIDGAPRLSLQQQFTKYAAGENQSVVSSAVEAWCARIGLKVRSVSVVQAGDQDPRNYDWAKKMIAA